MPLRPSLLKLAAALICLCAWLMPVTQAPAATPAPSWQLLSFAMPSHFAPGSTESEIFLVASNLGGEAAKGPITITDTLPEGITPFQVLTRVDDPEGSSLDCEIEPLDKQTITCTTNGPVGPSRQLEVKIFVEVGLDAKGTLHDEVAISGGGATEVKASTPIPISASPPPFDFLPGTPGFTAPLTEADGSPATQAGSHPYQLTLNLGFPTEKFAGGLLEGAGRLREATGDLPRGLIVNPAATPILCTEAQLVTGDCPAASQVGTVTVITFVATGLETTISPLFNMVSPPGQPASLGFNATGIGIFVHLSGEVRSEEDFGITGSVYDALALPSHPIFGTRLELWGDPSDPSHDKVRGTACVFLGDPKEGDPNCGSIEPFDTALLTLPSDCPGKAMGFEAHATSWEAPGITKHAKYESASLSGTPASLGGCNELDFEPTIEAKPTTNLTDSPAGLDFTLRQPQDTSLTGRSTANLKDAILALPQGLVVNPSAAQGQEACTPAQIGLKTAVGQTPHFLKTPASCPKASKLGTLEVKTPLLAQVDEPQTKVLRDPEGNPIPRLLEGSLYLAQPYQNPFGSLLALYLDLEDAQSGTVAKFAARVVADPITGQLTNVLTEGPELPIEEVRVKTFTGPRAALRTPLACETYTSTAQLVPWSAPEGPIAAATDSFAITAAPGGGPCPTKADAAPNKPDFVAGALAPQAGAYSPFILKISRKDGSQPIGGFEATLPPGLTAKLAGIPYCPEAAIAQAYSRAHPNEGALEQASPSCPAASEVGTVEVAAGAGPTPYTTSGRIYLAGPYKGAPLSAVVITPALAGPFDLGAVVVRTALYLNPETAIVRAVSDPLPTILEGIPLDLRSATVRMGRPQFTLNPTSCDPKSALATTTSVFGQSASLSSPFQVGGCKALGFKPKFSFRLKGPTKRTGHPALTVSGTFKAGQANLERAAIALPRSEFLDQAHIGTVCTRVQFAAKQCPQRSIYGFAKAKTPLLDQPLKGPVYLRSSNHELPDLVLALSGQVEVVVGSRVDSVNGGIRATAENVPDAPVSKFTIEMRGGRKGLLINSTNLCAKASYATVKLDAHNGKTHDFKALMQNDCKKKKRGKGKGKGRK